MTPTPETIPDFTPVPRRHKRHDGWTPERQRGFIEALAELCSVKAAAMRVGMTPESAYQLRRHPEADEFRKAWETALKHGIRHLEDVALERALHGIEVPVYCYGNLIGTRRVYNDSLLMFMLRNRAPKRFSADSLTNTDAATRGQLDRLKKQWRQQWEEEQAVERQKSSEEVFDAIDRKLDKMRQRQLARMSPETRAAHDAYMAACKADEERNPTSWTTPALASPAPDSPPPPQDDPQQEPDASPSIARSDPVSPPSGEGTGGGASPTHHTRTPAHQEIPP